MPPATNRTKIMARRQVELPPQTSSGYLVRDAHRAFQRLLERRIAAYGVSRGQWYFLRVLWITDGLSQRELSARVGMMEPTTVIALRSMEKSGLIRRVRGDDDRRKVRVFLTAKAKRERRVRRAAVDRFHDAGPAARRDDIVANAVIGNKRTTAFRHKLAKAPRILIPTFQLIARTRPSAAEYHDGRSNGPGAQPLLRLCVFELQADAAHGVAQQKIRIERGKAKCS